MKLRLAAATPTIIRSACLPAGRLGAQCVVVAGFFASSCHLLASSLSSLHFLSFQFGAFLFRRAQKWCQLVWSQFCMSAKWQFSFPHHFSF
jgi:hypothetical protein